MRWLLPEAMYWQVPTKEKKIYLTFDDGPTEDITPIILELLRQYNVKATFFCVGENITKHPDEFQAILNAGHAVGNHSFNHLKGWKTDNKTYFDNIEKCNQLHPFELFRPPYGKISPRQARHLSKQYCIVLWSVLSYDFKKSLLPEACLKNVIEHTNLGSIVVFHDHFKAYQNMIYALPRFIEYYLEKEYSFEILSKNDFPKSLNS
ncbi:MAG: polysaccharide deacetylase family protein [Bacteroidota bacterium]